ncbi:MAG: DUF3794 domain-containing protein [Ruminococcus sp.]|nr:DUF3794 domain-containing protein [Ruminococcus sp.]
MELNLTQTPVSSLVEALNTVSEQPVDIDFTLPDYCPDIEKILRCKITPKIYNRNLSGGQLQIEGSSVISVLYVDSEKGAIRACEQSLPFSASFRLNDVTDDYVIETSVKCEYVNCRALSRRRLTVHGAFSLYAKVLTRGMIELYSPDGVENIEFRSSDITLSALSSLAGEQFSVFDEIQINDNSTVEIIIDSNVKANITDYKIIPEKLMLNGELNVRVLYISDVEAGKPRQLDYIVPFSEVVDCIGLNDDSTVCVNLSMMSYDLSLKSEILTDGPVITVDAKIGVTVRGYSSECLRIAKDAYSTEFVSEPDFARLNSPADTKLLSDTFMHKDTLSLGDVCISEIMDFESNVCPLMTKFTDDKLVISSKVNINILAYNSENEPVYIERAVDVCKELDIPDDFNNILCSEFSIISVSYRLGDENNIDIRCEMKYCLTLQKAVCLNFVSSVNVDESKPLSKRNCALTLYYADKGEEIWKIAKLYNTKQSLIVSENDLLTETLEQPLMLLIPTV